MQNLLIYKGSEIHYEDRNGHIMVNVTEFAKAFPEKNLSKIINSDEIQEYIETLSDITNVSSADLLKVVKGGRPNEQGTWTNRKVALRIAQKLSTEFAIMVDSHIESLLSSKQTTVEAQGSALKIGERTFFPYGLMLQRFGLPYNKYRLMAAIGSNRSEFAMLGGLWYVSEDYVSYIENILNAKSLRLRFNEQNKALQAKEVAHKTLFST